MKKIILSLAFLFAVLIINSCSEDDTVSPDANTPKIKSFTEVYTSNDEVRTNKITIEYKDNYMSKLSFVEGGENGDVYFTYENGKIKNFKSSRIEKGTTIINETIFTYSNNLLTEAISYQNSQVLSKTKYSYSGSNLIEVIRSNYDGILTVDSTYCNEFINGRPGFIERFRRYQLNSLQFTEAEKFVYQNGNLVEIFEKWSENENFHLSLKKEFDLTKKSLFSYIQDFILIANNKYPYFPNHMDANLETKRDQYNIYCDGMSYKESVIYSSNPITYSYNSNGLINKLTSGEIPYCGQRNISTSEVSFIWDNDPF